MNRTTRPWRRFFGSSTIIPSDINKVKQFASNIVLYNNNICVTKNVNVESIYSDFTKQLRVKVTCDVPFKMYLYYTTEIARTVLPTLLKRSFMNKIQSNKTKAGALEDQVKNLFDEIEALKVKDVEKRRRQTELRTEQTELNIKIKTHIQILGKNTESFNQELATQQKYLAGVKSNELYVIGSRIQRIFNMNTLKSSVNEQIVIINKFIDEETLKIKTYRENFLIMSKNEKNWKTEQKQGDNCP